MNNRGRSFAAGNGDIGPPDRDPLMDFVSRWWWLLVIGVVLGASGAVAYAQYGPGSYSSTSLVQVQAQTENDPTAKADQARSATANYAAEASSTRVFALVSDATGGEFKTADLSQMERNGTIAIKAMNNANFVTIKVTHSDPELARYLADTIATVIVDDINVRSQTERDQRSVQLSDQIAFTREQLASAELFNREVELESQISDQRSSLLSLQASYQQELARQAEATSALPEADSVYGAYLEVVTSQIAEIEGRLESLNGDLQEVRDAISKLPAGSDAVLSGAYASAYSEELAALTRQYVAQQLATVTAKPPLVRYGDASTPVRAQSLRKLGLLGVAAGGTIAAGIAYALELLRKRRTRPAAVQGNAGGELDFERLFQTLNQFGAGQMTAATDQPLKRHNAPASDHRPSPVTPTHFE